MKIIYETFYFFNETINDFLNNSKPNLYLIAE